MGDNKKSTQATSSANGWAFQVSAGICLMLDNIKEFTHVKMEGATEDIELTLSNGNKIYAQAKAVSQIGDDTNALAYLKKSLGTLSTADDGEAKLIYITNIRNPLKSLNSSVYVFDHKYTYEILSTEDQEIILKYVDEHFSTKNFEVDILNFFGNGDEKYSTLKEKIKEFLQDANIDTSFSKRILNAWVTDFITNCTDKKLSLSKAKVIYPVIVVLIDRPVNEKDFSNVCDYDNFDEVQSKYRDFITRQCCDYQFISNIAGDYILNKQTLKTKEAYTSQKWKDYESNFIFESDIELREALIKLILMTVIAQKSDINKVKGAVNL